MSHIFVITFQKGKFPSLSLFHDDIAEGFELQNAIRRHVGMDLNECVGKIETENMLATAYKLELKTILVAGLK